MSSKIFASTKDADPKRVEEIIARAKEEEESLRFVTFTPDDAFTIGTGIRNKFTEVQQIAPTLSGEDAHKERFGHGAYQKFPANRGIAIHIETFTGHTLFTATAGPPTTNPTNWKWIRGKINVTKAQHASSYRIGREWTSRDMDPADIGFPFPEYAPFGGAFPIWIRGVTVAPVAVVAISGLSQDQDHQLIVDVLRAHLSKAQK